MTTPFKKVFTARNIFIAILIFACLLALWWTFLDIRGVYRGRQRAELQNVLRRRAATLDDIQPWMTFDYVNVLFRLPPAYLRSGIGITDRHYPNITIGHYARYQNTSPQAVIQEIQNAINRYRSGK